MADIMRPIPFVKMLQWICEEYRRHSTIFGIPESCFFRKENKKSIQLFDESCDTGIGPAAGPHTQLAQNIVAAYLVGGRFIELKTVQKLDSLKFEKPCIDARDEGYNTEWSQELSLVEAFDEYVKAWILLHFLEIVFNMSVTGKHSFIFNMSVGYDLEGIKTAKMDAFITGLTDASGHPLFERHLHEMDSFIREGGISKFMGPRGEVKGLEVEDLEVKDLDNISRFVSPHIAKSVTLSTMHGCPPEEIEAISRYLLKEKKLHTYVKLNPTLLGFIRVRKILDALGFRYIRLKEPTFTHDLQWDDAIGLLKRLKAFAADLDLYFGVKLSNTLGTVNTTAILPGEEMYMSGRALFPLTITLASRLSQEFEGNLPISFSGGASQLNILHIFETGIKPVTMVTELLKPGGYLRMAEIARKLEPLLEELEQSNVIDVEKLDQLAKNALHEDYYIKDWRGTDLASIDQKLPLTDCYVAPCVSSCPIHQDVPEYIRLVGDSEYDRALELIYMKNPLPNITGYICDHQCMYNCTRLDYEGAVDIREVKRIAAEHGKEAYCNRKKSVIERLDKKVAVIGAGPAGLSASYFLARNGFQVTVFEKRDSPGGVITHVMPRFRIPASAFERDISAIRTLGVDFRFGLSEDFSIQDIRSQGYRYIFMAIGAEVSRRLQLAGDNSNVYDALDFLSRFNLDSGTLNLGKRVAVIGGGNTAVDSARSAMRLGDVKEVTIIYRRTVDEMPVDREEFQNALEEGVTFKPLLLPESFSKKGILKCRRMMLGDPDSSRRRRPLPTENFEEMSFDSLISAIGEHTDPRILENSGLKLNQDGNLKVDPQTLETDIENVFIGGDAFRGPSTVVESIADARRAVDAISRKEIPEWRGLDEDFFLGFDLKRQISEIYDKKGKLISARPRESDKLIAENEAQRCLDCNVVCNKCVDVCPNRANLPIAVDKKEGFSDIWQILHLDALCNECGNCYTFCPYDGKPYKEKLTLFTLKEDFDKSTNDGFMVTESSGSQLIKLRLNGKLFTLKTGKQGKLLPEESQSPKDHDISYIKEASAIISTVLRDYGYLM